MPGQFRSLEMLHLHAVSWARVRVVSYLKELPRIQPGGADMSTNPEKSEFATPHALRCRYLLGSLQALWMMCSASLAKTKLRAGQEPPLSCSCACSWPCCERAAELGGEGMFLSSP